MTDTLLDTAKLLAAKGSSGSGIGTLSEKSLHAILKNYYEPDSSNQEILIGKYVADIFKNGEITEIQTRQLNKMRSKLDFFLPNHPVTIVHPIAHEKKIFYIDGETGEVSKSRKSPQKGTGYHAFRELYRIKMYLKDPNLRIRLILLDMDEYRIPAQQKRRRRRATERFDQIPTAVFQEFSIQSPIDYDQFLPEGLNSTFTTTDFAKIARINRPLAQTVVNILCYMGRIEKIGKQNRSILYAVTGTNQESPS